MPVVTTEGSTMAELMKLRRPRSQLGQSVVPNSDPHPETPSAAVEAPVAGKPTISSILVSSFSDTNDETTPRPSYGNSIVAAKKKNNFSSAAFRRLGCTAAAPSEVSVPAAIRASADWERKKKKEKKPEKRSESDGSGSGSGSGGIGCMVVEDVWCGAGIGFSADAASVDCGASRRNLASSSSSTRGKIDGEQLSQREHSSCLTRRGADPDTLSYLDSEPIFVTRRLVSSEDLRRKYYRHARHTSPEGLPEIMLFQNSLRNGGRLDSHDRFRSLRLDVDNMTYEELLDLGERIGYVSTGLKEDEIVDCVTKTKIMVDQKAKHLNHLATQLSMQLDWKCSICQEECEANEETGKLDCGHTYHLQCIKQWLAQKNSCPVCKIAAKC